ncbi:MAG: hypothetical protein K0R26_2854, partial [Bacteroidota bacterium]|nr:hypothetical protein [Bacteroidota bacterium]
MFKRLDFLSSNRFLLSKYSLMVRRIQGCNATKFFKGTYLNKKSINIQNNLFKVIS